MPIVHGHSNVLVIKEFRAVPRAPCKGVTNILRANTKVNTYFIFSLDLFGNNKKVKTLTLPA